MLFHKRTGALFGPDTVANQSQKAQPFLVEAVQNGTLSQCKKVTEENKTAELPGGASPTHTLTHKCRYAAYSMRFTESNPPPHTDTHLHTYTPSPLLCLTVVFLLPYTQIFSQVIQIRVLIVLHLTFASGQHKGQKVFSHHLTEESQCNCSSVELLVMAQINKTGANVMCPQEAIYPIQSDLKGSKQCFSLLSLKIFVAAN